MTLDDKGVLDEKDDVLVNVNMIDDEKFERVRPHLRRINCIYLNLKEVFRLCRISQNGS